MQRKFSFFEFSIGLITGFAAGAVTGLLLAPLSGEEARDRLKMKADDFRLSAQELIDNAKTSLELAANKLEGVLGLRERNLRKKLSELKAELENFTVSNG